MSDSVFAIATDGRDASSQGAAFIDGDQVLLVGMDEDEKQQLVTDASKQSPGTVADEAFSTDGVEVMSASEILAATGDLAADVAADDVSGADVVDSNEASLAAGDDNEYPQDVSAGAGDESSIRQEQTFEGDGDGDADFAANESGNASTSMGQSSSARLLSHHTKRRKINTCLPCKRRKVKCDRQKPYCGQCKKSSIPVDECTWSAAVEHPTTSTLPASAVSTLFPSTSFSTAGDVTADTSNATQWYDTGSNSWSQLASVNGNSERGSTQALLERIATLESVIASTSKLSARQDGSVGINGEANLFADALQPDAASDTDALSLIARQTSAAVAFAHSGHVSKLRCAKMFADPNTVLPVSAPIEIRTAIALLPSHSVVLLLLDIVDNVQRHGIFLGVSVKLFRMQLDHLITADLGHSPPELSFVASALYVCAVGVDLIASDQTFALTIVDTEDAIQDAVDELATAGETLLHAIEYDNRANINILVALALKRHLKATSGKTNAASATLSMTIQLARGIGITTLKSHEEEVAERASNTDMYEDARVVDSVTLLNPIYYGTIASSVEHSKTPWLLRRSTLVREAARALYTLLALQDWISDSVANVSVSDSNEVSLPLPAEPVDAASSYDIASITDETKPSAPFVLRHLYLIARNVANWRLDGQSTLFASAMEKQIRLYDRKAAAFDIGIEGIGADEVQLRQNTSAFVDLVRHYCLFILRRADAKKQRQCLESAVKILESRATLNATFPAPLHKFYDVQRFTLEAALMIVIQLHQLGTDISDERRQTLQSLINDAYAQPGFENAHSLLSLSFDLDETDTHTFTNGVKRAAPDEAGASTQAGGGGLKLSGSRRLSSYHPIVIGLRAFVHGQSQPCGDAPETIAFWSAVARQSQLFLVAA